MRLDRAAGMVVDDAWYVLLAKALADGRGYELINAPLAGILPGYPPGFPALLSFVFRIRPEFPANLWLLKSVSLAAMLGVAVLSYWYFHRLRQLPRHLAALAAIGVGATPAFVFLATSTVMSECVFTLAQLGAVAVAHRAIDEPAERTRLAIVAALLGAATVLIRSVGVGVVAAVFLCFVKERQWKRASVFAVVVALFVAPWLLYTRAHAPYPSSISRFIAARSSMDTASNSGCDGPDRPTSGRRNRCRFAGAHGRPTWSISLAEALEAYSLPVLLRPPEESGEEVVSLAGRVSWTFSGVSGGCLRNMAISLLLSADGPVGFVRTAARARSTVAEILVPVSLVITVLWPFWSFRFVLPLTPYLVFYFLSGLRRVQLWNGPDRNLQRKCMAFPPRIAVMVMLGLHCVRPPWIHRACASCGPEGRRSEWLSALARGGRRPRLDVSELPGPGGQRLPRPIPRSFTFGLDGPRSRWTECLKENGRVWKGVVAFGMLRVLLPGGMSHRKRWASTRCCIQVSGRLAPG